MSATKLFARRIIASLKILPGWLFVAIVLYVFVYKQWEIVSNPYLLFVIAVTGTVLSFLFSASEMAMAECKPEDRERIDDLHEEIMKKITAGRSTFDKKIYIRELNKSLQLSEIIENSRDFNPSIVIGNNVANVAITAFVPLAMHEPRIGNIPLNQIESNIAALFGGEDVTSIPLNYSEGLFTFFSVTLIILIFGEIIPKRIASTNPLGVVVALRPIIILSRSIFGWLGTALASATTIVGAAHRSFRR